MCEPVTLTMIGIGAATGAAGAAITGQDILTGALMGGIMGGITGGMNPGMLGAGSLSSTVGSLGGAGFSASTSMFTAVGSSITQAGFAGAVAMGLAASVAKGILMPEPEYNSEAYDYSPITYNSIENQVTGSGGNQAAAVLSDEIKRSKAKRAKQKEQPKQDSYVNTESFANTGLQLA
jgi:hypothetical protein